MRIDETGALHPVGKVASQRMRARKGAFRLMPAPEHVIFLRYVGEDGSKEYYSTFVGFFPADNPQVTILVSMDRPDPESQDHLGGKAAGPLFSTLATIAMHELRISPSPNDAGCQDSGG